MSDHEPATTPAPPLRAADADRAQVVRVLQDAVGRGLLTPDEGSDRMAAAWATRHVHELPALTADLPPAPATHPPGAAAPGWRPLAAMAAAQVRATVGELRAAGLRSPRTAAVLAAVLGVLTVLLLLAGIAGHALFDGGPGGPGDFPHR